MFSKIRNNPKKSIFFSGLIVYGGYFLNGKYQNYELRRKFCAEAKTYGELPINPLKELTRVTVIHNPIANNRNCEDIFKKNVFPLLNLSGYKVTVVETLKAEEAKEMMAFIKPDDQECLFVAGGDGTLMEVATGLLRRTDLRAHLHKMPLVSAPMGKTNSFASKFYRKQQQQQPAQTASLDSIRACDKSVKLIQKNRIKPINVLSIRSIPDKKPEDETNSVSDIKPKEIYALSGLEWSIDCEVRKNGSRKWLFGPYRQHFQYVYTAIFGKYKTTNKTATLIYKEACQGCSKCANKILEDKNYTKSGSIFGSIGRILFPMFFKESIIKEKENAREYKENSQIVNPNCGLFRKKEIYVRGLSIILDEENLKVNLINTESEAVKYIKSGIKKFKEIPYDINNECDETFTCSEIKILPNNQSTEKFFIDNEELEALPVEISVLKDALYFYS